MDHTEPVRVDWQLKFEEEKAKNERLVKRIDTALTYIDLCAWLMVDDRKEARKKQCNRILAEARRLREEANRA